MNWSLASVRKHAMLNSQSALGYSGNVASTQTYSLCRGKKTLPFAGVGGGRDCDLDDDALLDNDLRGCFVVVGVVVSS